MTNNGNTDIQQLLQRMEALVAELNLASEAYYNGQGEQMTDFEWDARFDELRRLEQQTWTVLPDSPTQNVSRDDVAGKKEAHEFAALSLAKTKRTEDLVQWAEGRPVWVSWKLDGLTLMATYDGGQLTKVVTRGNGHIGTNITHLAQAISGIPQHIAEQGHTVIRGEAVISYADFEQFEMERGEGFANPRNLASGTLTLKDPDEVRRRHVQWIPFTLVYTVNDIPSWGERMDWLDQQGFHTVERTIVAPSDYDNIQQTIDSFTHRVTDRSCPFPVDGLVVCYDDVRYAQTGSVTGHHATRAGLAFKWQDEVSETELLKVEWSCAANTISPVAVFRPVSLEGTTVQRASLCNISECERLGIGGEGTRLQVIKANKIIPKVIGVTQAVGQLHIPAECPVCHAATEVRVSEASGTRTLHCTNGHCPARQLRIFARFVSKEGMNIDGVSEQTLAKFINRGWIREFADIFTLGDHVREMAQMEGFGQRSAANIRQHIEQARTVEAPRLLYALSIPLCGTDVCKRLLAAYPLESLVTEATKGGDNLFAAPREPEEVFAHVAGIGSEKSAAVVRWFRNTDNMEHYQRLMQQVTVSKAAFEPAGNRCQGLTFVVTGDLHHFQNRNVLKAYIESQGGHVASAVSGSTSFLINNDIHSTSGKNKKAQQLNIPIISEDQFVADYGG